MPRTQSNDPTEWVEQIFEAKSVKTGGVLKRLIKSVEKRGSHNHLINKVIELGFHMFVTDTHYIIICSKNFKLKPLC